MQVLLYVLRAQRMPVMTRRTLIWHQTRRRRAWAGGSGKVGIDSQLMQQQVTHPLMSNR
jgi:hypothetical protein